MLEGGGKPGLSRLLTGVSKSQETRFTVFALLSPFFLQQTTTHSSPLTPTIYISTHTMIRTTLSTSRLAPQSTLLLRGVRHASVQGELDSYFLPRLSSSLTLPSFSTSFNCSCRPSRRWRIYHGRFRFHLYWSSRSTSAIFRPQERGELENHFRPSPNLG